jgi:wyosine [tRNA(Phe)-imidazoG37] synthetase (radical SAM superfamily)
MIAFGPVPSRRLGSSLGINHIPPKYCPYSCVYCQVGRTTHMQIEREAFYSPDQVIRDVDTKIAQCLQAGKKIDHLTLVPDGEPTLDLNLGKLIGKLKSTGRPIAVISNGSLIDRADVQDDLLQADWVSLKIDALDEGTWRKIDRPHHRLSLSRILEGILSFRARFQGKLVTETMLIAGLNDHSAAAQSLCAYLLELQPSRSYLSIPTRPPAEPGISAPAPQALQEVLRGCSSCVSFIELLFETEIGDFVSTGDLAEDIRSITAVHPLREGALRQIIARADGEWKVVEDLLAAGEIHSIQHRGERFFMRRLPSDSRPANP